MASWETLVETSTFLFAVWCIGYLCKSVQIPPIVGEIALGIVLGPRVANFVPFTEVHQDSIFAVLGTIGVTLVVLESGFHVNFTKLKKLGWRVGAIGLLGTLFPMVIGWAVCSAIGFDSYPGAFTAAIIIAPASVGVALRVLIPRRKLNTSYGQAIVIAATIDDLMALILFVVLQKVTAADDPSPVEIGLPVAGAILLIVICGALSWWAFPKMIKQAFIRLVKNPEHSYLLRDQFHIVAIFLMLIGLSFLGHLVGSHLLGAFLAGLLFSRVRRSHMLWRTQVKQTMSWLLRLFFAATVAFEVPVDLMFGRETIWKGLVVATVCIISKLMAALHLPKTDRWLVGFALVGRGEFSYLIADFALEEELITEGDFGVLVWGLLLSTLISPIVLQWLIRRSSQPAPPEYTGTAFLLKIEGHRHYGLVSEIVDDLEAFGFDVVEGKIESSTNLGLEELLIVPQKSLGIVDQAKLDELEEELRETIDDKYVQIDFIETHLTENGVLEFEVMGHDVEKINGEIFELVERRKFSVDQPEYSTGQGHVELCKIRANGRITHEVERREIEEEIDAICGRKKYDGQVMVRLSPCLEI